MIKAYLISKELAILLKEAGFEDECTYYYEKLNIPENEKHIPFNFNVLNSRYSAPLTNHLIDWLDSKGIFIDIIPRKTNNGIEFSNRIITNEKVYFNNNVSPTRKEALDEALKMSIKLYIKIKLFINKIQDGINNK